MLRFSFLERELARGSLFIYDDESNKLVLHDGTMEELSGRIRCVGRRPV
jgi:hypothetical protein